MEVQLSILFDRFVVLRNKIQERPLPPARVCAPYKYSSHHKGCFSSVVHFLRFSTLGESP